jgi:type VI secretion system protein ImpA
MKYTIDIDAILSPIPGENPAGEDLRYEPVYDDIKEARRADDELDRGAWEYEIKAADWDKAMGLCAEALAKRTKDLQIGAWLTEALVKIQGFEGLATGLKILTCFLKDFWDNVYPEIDEDDLDYRVGPLEFLNNNLWFPIKAVPVTDPRVSPGYSWLLWQESRQVGSAKDLENEFGDINESKKAARDEKIAEGKLPAEDFDSAVASSSKAFYVELDAVLASCVDEFKAFDETVDKQFGNEGPRLAELKQSIEDCALFISRTLKKKREIEPDPQPETEVEPAPEVSAAVSPETLQAEPATGVTASAAPLAGPVAAAVPAGGGTSVLAAPVQLSSNIPNDSDSMEQVFWDEALNILKTSGMKKALATLLHASSSAPSIRQKSRYRLLLVKLCIKAGKPELARPIIEELYGLIEQLGLEQWESPMWIAEVLAVYYQILTVEGAPDDDINKAYYELYPRIVTKDITKAMEYK